MYINLYIILNNNINKGMFSLYIEDYFIPMQKCNMRTLRCTF